MSADNFWAASWKTPDLTVGNYTTDPNTTPPADDRMFQITGVDRGRNTTLLMFTSGGSTASVTATYWMYEATSKKWVILRSALAVTASTPGTLTSIPGMARIYVQVTASANSPVALSVGFMLA